MKMTEDHCVICGSVAPDGYDLCPTCRERLKDVPVETEVVLWRPFPLIKPGIIYKEYLVASDDEGVYISLWDGAYWQSRTTKDFKSGNVIAWTNLPSPYKKEDPITDAFYNHHEYVFVYEEDSDEQEGKK